MAERASSSGIIAGAVTILGLVLVWVTVSANFPSQEELFSVEMPPETRRVADTLSPPSGPPKLDLTIPTSPPISKDAGQSRLDKERRDDSRVDAPVVTELDSSRLQASRLKCEAEIDQLCPYALDGSGRISCLEQRVKQLTAPCQGQLRERFVRWKQDRSRLVAACDEDISRFCRAINIGSGEILQCLQSHGQEVSDQCYQILPKGTVFFK